MIIIKKPKFVTFCHISDKNREWNCGTAKFYQWYVMLLSSRWESDFSFLPPCYY